MKKEEIIELEAVSTLFYSCLDEDSYFGWLEKISCISSFKGVGCSLFISIKKESVDWENLRDLIAVFYRYEIDMRQLSVFDSDDFPGLKGFKNKDAYYYDRIWGDEKPKKRQAVIDFENSIRKTKETARERKSGVGRRKT